MKKRHLALLASLFMMQQGCELLESKPEEKMGGANNLKLLLI